MPNPVFGDTSSLRFEIAPKDPASFSMRSVDIHAAGAHLTARDNSAYVPSLLFRLDRTLRSFRGQTRFRPRPDIFGERGPEAIHRLLADESEEFAGGDEVSDLWTFLDFGDTVLHVLGFLIPTQGRLYLTVDMLRPGEENSRAIRVVEVREQALAQSMSATLDLVAADYDGDKSSLQR